MKDLLGRLQVENYLCLWGRLKTAAPKLGFSYLLSPGTFMHLGVMGEGTDLYPSLAISWPTGWLASQQAGWAAGWPASRASPAWESIAKLKFSQEPNHFPTRTGRTVHQGRTGRIGMSLNPDKPSIYERSTFDEAKNHGYKQSSPQRKTPNNGEDRKSKIFYRCS